MTAEPLASTTDPLADLMAAADRLQAEDLMVRGCLCGLITQSPRM